MACNESKSLVLHSGIPPFAPHALRTLAPHARTHRTTVAPLVYPPSWHAARSGTHCTALFFFARVFFFVATLCRRASVSLVSSTLTQLNSAYEPKRNERLRIRGLYPLVPFLPYGRMHAFVRMYLRFNPFGLSQKQPQVNQHKRNKLLKLHLMKAPSIKTLCESLHIDKDKAKLVRALIKKEQKTTDENLFPSTFQWIQVCYHRPSWTEMVLSCFNEILEGYGVEAIQGESFRFPLMTYVNLGETYQPTLLFCYKSQAFRVQSWGDYVEINRL